MIAPQHLPRAPIREAIIDIQVEHRDGLTVNELEQRIPKTDFGYYVKGPISEGVFGFTLTPDGRSPAMDATTAQIGLRLDAHNEPYVLQWRLTGFTLSRLRPYDDWTRLRAEANRLWQIYAQCVEPLQIRRIATRYINDLQLPINEGEPIEKFIDTLVDLPKGMPQVVAGFFQRFQLVDVETGARVNLSLALQPTAPGAPLPVILDIDAFSQTVAPPSSPVLCETLERLRDLKNRVFFSVITEAAAELYR